MNTGSITTSGCANVTTFETQYIAPHTHCVRPGKRRANQYGFIQEGECGCGQKYTRRVLWSGTFDDWREVDG